MAALNNTRIDFAANKAAVEAHGAELERKAAAAAEPSPLPGREEGWQPRYVPIPEECLKPGGLLEEIMSYMDTAAPKSDPVFNLAGAIVAVGTLAGQLVMTETGLRTNFYCIALGNSGSGKNTPIKAAKEMLRRSNHIHKLGGSSFTSDSSLLRHLEGDPCCCFLLDEIGELFRAMKNERSPLNQVHKILLELFSCTDTGYAKRYADKKLDINLPWHHFSFFGAATPVSLWPALQSKEAADGFLARCLVFEHITPYERPDFFKKVEAIPPNELLRHINGIPASPVTEKIGDSGNLSDLTGDSFEVPCPRVIRFTQEAKIVFDAYGKENADIIAIHEKEIDPLMDAVLKRTEEHTAKLALIHAFSRVYGTNLDELCIDEADVRWAAELMKWLNSVMERGLRENLSDSKFEADMRQVEAVIRKYQEKTGRPVPRSIIENRIQRLDNRDISRILEKLELSERVLAEEQVIKSGKYHGTTVVAYSIK